MRNSKLNKQQQEQEQKKDNKNYDEDKINKTRIKLAKLYPKLAIW